MAGDVVMLEGSLENNAVVIKVKSIVDIND